MDRTGSLRGKAACGAALLLLCLSAGAADGAGWCPLDYSRTLAFTNTESDGSVRIDGFIHEGRVVVTGSNGSPRSYLNLAEAYLHRKDYRMAFDNYQSAMKAASMEHGPLSMDLLAHAEANCGTMLLTMPGATPVDIATSEKMLRGSLSLAPRNGAASLALAMLLNGRAEHYKALQILEDATVEGSQVAQLREDQLHFETGVALCGLHLSVQADSQLHKAASMGYGIKEARCSAEGQVYGLAEAPLQSR